MTYDTLEDFNATGSDGLLQFVAHTWAGFFPLVLFLFFMIIVLSTYFSQKRLSGLGNLPASFMVASLTTFGLATAMTLVGGLIDQFTFIITFLVLVGVSVWFFTSQDRMY